MIILPFIIGSGVDLNWKMMTNGLKSVSVKEEAWALQFLLLKFNLRVNSKH